MSAEAGFDRVEAAVEPYDRTLDRYQSYYRNSLAAYCGSHSVSFQETGSRFRGLLRVLQRTRASDRFRKLLPAPFGPRFIDGVATMLGAPRPSEQVLGTYVFHGYGRAITICIDSADSGEICYPDALQGAHLYFKTNYWPTRTYPAKVLPIANLNPLVLGRMKHLQRARNAEKEWDLFGFFRVWGGTDEVEGVEHNLALFETLARLRCKKKLLAFLVSGDIRSAAARLEKAGVPWTTKWMPIRDLWDLAARSRLNIVRHGMHECIPWRMTDILAMGGCPVLDYAATTRWHVPLQENVHYLSLDFPYRPSCVDAFDAATVAERVESWLADPKLIGQIGQSTARYFDEHLALEKLGGYIFDSCRLNFDAN
jgi:hypothetical protein